MTFQTSLLSSKLSVALARYTQYGDFVDRFFYLFPEGKAFVFCDGEGFFGVFDDFLLGHGFVCREYRKHNTTPVDFCTTWSTVSDFFTTSPPVLRSYSCSCP